MILKWLSRILAKLRGKSRNGRPARWPTREEIAELPLFESIELPDIVEVSTPDEARRAHEELRHAKVLGFDTESKPTFVKGEVSTGPHVAQFSTLERAYIFMLHDPEVRRVVKALISSKTIQKVGFGLSEDVRRIPIKLGIQPECVLDIETIFTAKGYGRGVGVKVAVALALKRRFIKSRKASTSNWMKRRLDERQLLYAANDAYAAIKVFHKLVPVKR